MKLSSSLCVIASPLIFLIGLPVSVALPDHANGKGPPTTTPAAQKAFKHWTAARQRSAKPRDLIRLDPSGRAGPAKRIFNKREHGHLRKLQFPGTTTTIGNDPYTADDLIKQATGILYFDIGTSGYRCSATVVEDPSTPGYTVLVTAGHCAYEYPDFVTNIIFIPDRDSSGVGEACSQDDLDDGETPSKYGCFFVESSYIDQTYADESTFSDTAVQHDYAFLKVPNTGSFFPGYDNPDNANLENLVGGIPVDFSTPQGALQDTHTWGVGYPADNGRDLRYCADGYDPAPACVDKLSERGRGACGFVDGTGVIPACEMQGGSSGGAWINNDGSGNPKIVGLNSYGYNRYKGMGGPVMSTTAQCVRNEAEFGNGSGCTIATNAPAVITCSVDTDCDDGAFCNGAETCNAGVCQAGTPPNCDDGIACTDDSCDEAADVCVSTPNDDLCDNGSYCDGVETCHATLGCQAGTAPDCGTFECNEGNGQCNECSVNTDCTTDPNLYCASGNCVECTDDTHCLTAGETCQLNVCSSSTCTCSDCDLQGGGPCKNCCGPNSCSWTGRTGQCS